MATSCRALRVRSSGNRRVKSDRARIDATRSPAGQLKICVTFVRGLTGTICGSKESQAEWRLTTRRVRANGTAERVLDDRYRSRAATKRYSRECSLTREAKEKFNFWARVPAVINT